MNIDIFESKVFGKLRIIKGKEKVGFLAVDVAKALGYEAPSKAVIDHCTGVLKWKHHEQRAGAPPYNIIFEPDVYRLIFRSKLPSAVKFQDWVFEEVLPSLRSNGSYSLEKIPETKLEWIQECAKIESDRLKLEQENKILIPKAEFHDKVVKTENAISIREVAKILDTGEKRLFKKLRENKVLMRDNTPYQTYIDRGYFVVQGSLYGKHGKEKQYCQTLVTGKGVTWLQKSSGNSLIMM